MHHFKFDYIALQILLFGTISCEFMSYNKPINLCLTFENLKFENSLLLFFFLFRSRFHDILNQCTQQHGTSFVYTIKKLSAVYLAYNFKYRQSNICWSSEMPHLSIGTITIRKKVWHISWQCHFKIVRNDYQSNF